MKDHELNKYLLTAIKEKVPQRRKLVNILTDLLSIEKEAVYRRLRNEVPFTFAEATIISNQLGIFMDNIMRMNGQRGRPFQLNVIEYAGLFDIDYMMLEQHAGFLKLSRNCPFSEIAETSNMLPVSLYARSELLSRFYLFKWRYHMNSTGSTYFNDIELPPRLSDIYQSFFIESKHINNTIYIWDYAIFQYLVNDLKYFQNIQLITGKEIALFKEELFRFLDYTENIAITGIFEETGKTVNCYISDINLETCYSYVHIDDHYMSLIRTFILNSVVSIDKRTFERVKEWVQSMKRSSTLVSGSGEKQRVAFFNRQREIIGTL